MQKRLLFKIAKDIGGHTLEELEAKLSYEELVEWGAYYSLEAEEMEQAQKAAESKAKQKPKGGRF